MHFMLNCQTFIVGLRFQQKSVSCPIVADENKFLLKSESRLLHAINLCDQMKEI